MSVEEVVERIVTLRHLTEQNGVITKRTQNELLAALPSDILAEVALRLENIKRNERHEQSQHHK